MEDIRREQERLETEHLNFSEDLRLYYSPEGKICIPDTASELQERIVARAHELALHPGVKRTVTELFVWTNLKAKVMDLVRKCSTKDK